jgi:hypothetical protein
MYASKAELTMLATARPRIGCLSLSPSLRSFSVSVSVSASAAGVDAHHFTGTGLGCQSGGEQTKDSDSLTDRGSVDGSGYKVKKA